MARWFAGIAAIFLVSIGGFLALSGRTEEMKLPPAPSPRLAAAVPMGPIPNAPEADPRSKERKRFVRADKDENGRITLAELIEPRRKAFTKLDADKDGRLSFEEWAARSIGKFQGADADGDKALSPSEFAATGPKPRPKKPGCSCA